MYIREGFKKNIKKLWKIPHKVLTTPKNDNSTFRQALPLQMPDFAATHTMMAATRTILAAIGAILALT